MTAPVAPQPSPHYAYFLDIDGTIVELAEAPDAVRAGAQLVQVIKTLRVATGGAVALISGRALADIDRLFPHAPLPAAGQHGTERRTTRGTTRRESRALTALNASRDLLSTALAKYPKLLLEDKGQSLALHYRAAPHLAPVAFRLMRSALAAAGDPYVLQTGKRVVELRPGGHNKGLAITEFMREFPFRGRTPVFLGDDQTDEAGFRVVNHLWGFTIKVGPGPTLAHWRLADAREAVTWLATGWPAPAPVRRARRRSPSRPNTTKRH